MLRARKVRQSLQQDPIAARAPGDPGREAALADSVAAALLIVLETLSPTERVAFVLHDVFDLPFDEIGRVLDRSEAATRQLASRARRRVQRVDQPEGERAGRQVVDAFLAASRAGDFDALLAVLDPDVVVRIDDIALRTAVANNWSGPELTRETHGARAAATLFKGRAAGAKRATIDGDAGAVWAPQGRPRSAFVFTVADDRIIALDLIMEPDALAELDIVILERAPG
jgi:RNA polymerase sigma-70 factor (ECF subfamily)